MLFLELGVRLVFVVVGVFLTLRFLTVQNKNQLKSGDICVFSFASVKLGYMRFLVWLIDNVAVESVEFRKQGSYALVIANLTLNFNSECASSIFCCNAKVYRCR